MLLISLGLLEASLRLFNATCVVIWTLLYRRSGWLLATSHRMIIIILLGERIVTLILEFFLKKIIEYSLTYIYIYILLLAFLYLNYFTKWALTNATSNMVHTCVVTCQSFCYFADCSSIFNEEEDGTHMCFVLLFFPSARMCLSFNSSARKCLSRTFWGLIVCFQGHFLGSKLTCICTFVALKSKPCSEENISQRPNSCSIVIVGQEPNSL